MKWWLAFDCSEQWGLNFRPRPHLALTTLDVSLLGAARARDTMREAPKQLARASPAVHYDHFG